MTKKKEKRLATLRNLRDEASYNDLEAWDALNYAVMVLERLSRGGRRSKLSATDRNVIRDQADAGDSVRSLAEWYRVSESTIRRIIYQDEN